MKWFIKKDYYSLIYLFVSSETEQWVGADIVHVAAVPVHIHILVDAPAIELERSPLEAQDGGRKCGTWCPTCGRMIVCFSSDYLFVSYYLQVLIHFKSLKPQYDLLCLSVWTYRYVGMAFLRQLRKIDGKMIFIFRFLYSFKSFFHVSLSDDS